MKTSITRLSAVLLSLAVAAHAQDPLANTGGSTAIGAGAGSAAPSQSVRVDPVTLPPTGSSNTNGSAATPQEVGGTSTTAATGATATGTTATGTTSPNVGLSLISGNGSTIVPRDGGSVQRINADGTRQAFRVNGGATTLPNGTVVTGDGTVVNTNPATTVSDANGTTITGAGQVTNTNGAGPVIPPANPLLAQPQSPGTGVVSPLGATFPVATGTGSTGVTATGNVVNTSGNTGAGNGPGLTAGGIAPSGPRIEAATTSQAGAGSVAPSGPRVESLPAQSRTSVGTAGTGSVSTGGTVGAQTATGGASTTSATATGGAAR